MALIFLGSVGEEQYIEAGPDGKDTNKRRPYQQFKAGVKLVKESFQEKRMTNEPALGPDGKALVDGAGNQILKPVEQLVQVDMAHVFRPVDIGKPYDKFKDEADVLKRYPRMFKKA